MVPGAVLPPVKALPNLSEAVPESRSAGLVPLTLAPPGEVRRTVKFEPNSVEPLLPVAPP